MDVTTSIVDVALLRKAPSDDLLEDTAFKFDAVAADARCRLLDQRDAVLADAALLVAEFKLRIGPEVHACAGSPLHRKHTRRFRVL
jgi:hypothetical protein